VRIEAVRQTSEQVPVPTSKTFVGSFTVNVKIGQLVRKRRVNRLIGVVAIVIEDAVLSGIGKGRKELLRAYNVEDAYDVAPSTISNIKGFGPTMRATLLAWRSSLELTFQFDPNRGIDPGDARAIEQEMNQRRADAIRALANGPQILQQSLDVWYTQQGSVMEQLKRSAKRLAETEVDMRALRRW
jgi:DNA-binding helix-hairpin-helix protein with protein kinase domain